MEEVHQSVEEPRVTKFEVKTLFVGLLVGIGHLISGLATFVQPAVLHTTPLAALHRIVGSDDVVVALSLIFAGLLAILASNRSIGMPPLVRALLFLPQEALMLLQILSITMALVMGKYPDGYVPVGGAWFILTDQVWAWVLAVSHSLWLGAFCWTGVISGNRTEYR